MSKCSSFFRISNSRTWLNIYCIDSNVKPESDFKKYLKYIRHKFYFCKEIYSFHLHHIFCIFICANVYVLIIVQKPRTILTNILLAFHILLLFYSNLLNLRNAKYLSFCIMHHVIACKKYHAFSIPLELKERLESDLISLSITAKDCLDLLNLFCISSFFHVVDP